MNTEMYRFLQSEIFRTKDAMVDKSVKPTCKSYVSPTFHIGDSTHSAAHAISRWINDLKSNKISQHAKAGVLVKNGGYILAVSDLADIQYIDMAINEASNGKP